MPDQDAHSNERHVPSPLRHVRHLYEPDAETARRLSSDEALRAEYATWQRVKHVLDERPPARPSADARAAVLRAAQAATQAAAEASGSARADRPARRRCGGRTWALRGVAAAVLLMALWGGGSLLLDASRDAPVGPPAASQSASPELPSQSGASQSGASQAEAWQPSPSGDAAPSGAEALLAWDMGEEVRRLHRQVEVVRSRTSPAEWLTPASHVLPQTP